MYDPELPDCVICELRTLISQRLLYDKCIEPVAQVLFAQYRLGNKIFLISGFDESVRSSLIEALENNSIDYDELFMREIPNYKENIYNKHIKDKYNVLFVIEDNFAEQDIKMWESKDLFVFSC